jgi:hypothetical protein
MLGFGPLAGAEGPPVHVDAIVPNNKGGFDAVTMDRGSFSSLSGDQLTITEGTKSATYKTVTITIPANATVRRNEKKAELTDLKAGNEVKILRGPDGTVVAAHDAQHPGPLGLKLTAPGRGDGMPPPKLPALPDEGASSHSGAGSTELPEPGA